MQSISAIIITYNEARNIERCLRSLQGVVDEIIVLDSFSTDATADIASQFNVRFVQRAWEGYSASKNYANSLASHNLIFSIDADEAVSDALKSSILKFKQQSDYTSASMNRLTNYCGAWIKHCGWYPDKKVRLFHRNEAAWSGTIHEELTFVNKETRMHLTGDLLHYSYYTKDDHYRQMEKFTTISSQDDYERGKRTNVFMPYLSACMKFIQSYLFHAGFLDGYAGFLVCSRSAYASYLKYAKLLKHQHGNQS